MPDHPRAPRRPQRPVSFPAFCGPAAAFAYDLFRFVSRPLLERHTGEARTKVIADTTKATLHAEVRANVAAGAGLYTDTHAGYQGLGADYVHETVTHLDEYVRGAVHTNHLENYWTLFKRCYHGTWTHLSDDHLHRYLVEQEYRFNNRKGNDGGRFIGAVRQVRGKRLTYKKLTGKEEEEEGG